MKDSRLIVNAKIYKAVVSFYGKGTADKMILCSDYIPPPPKPPDGEPEWIDKGFPPDLGIKRFFKWLFRSK
jgi:hypothetical protein